jgi:hypothetical protein
MRIAGPNPDDRSWSETLYALYLASSANALASGPILTMDRRPSAVLTRVLAARLAP